MSQDAGIQTFLNKFTNGGARPNRFRLEFSHTLLNGETSEKLKVLAYSASLPASSISSASLHYCGREIKIPGERTFANWDVTIYNDDFSIRNFFESWMNKIRSHKGNTSDYYKPVINDQFATCKVFQLGRDNSEIKTYELWGISPTELSDIKLDMSEMDSIETFQVTFTVNEWYCETYQLLPHTTT